MGEHDTYGFAHAAQLGGSQGRPITHSSGQLMPCTPSCPLLSPSVWNRSHEREEKSWTGWTVWTLRRTGLETAGSPPGQAPRRNALPAGEAGSHEPGAGVSRRWGLPAPKGGTLPNLATFQDGQGNQLGCSRAPEGLAQRRQGTTTHRSDGTHRLSLRSGHCRAIHQLSASGGGPHTPQVERANTGCRSPDDLCR